MLLRPRLDPDLHGSAGYTSLTRITAVGMLLGFLGVGSHLATQAWYAGKILPGVVVAGHDLSGQSLAQARKVLQDTAKNYRLTLTIAAERYTLSAADLGVTFDVEATLESAYSSGRQAWVAPTHHDPLDLSYQLDRNQLNYFATSVAKKVGTPPVDAAVVVRSGQIQTVAEKSGWTIDRLSLERLIETDVRSPGGIELNLKPREQVADIRTATLAPTIAAAKNLMAVPIVLSYANQTFTPTQTDIGQWIGFVKQPDGQNFKLVPQIDSSKLKGYVQGIANKLDVSAINKTVTVENGVSKTTQEGVDGSAIDSDPLIAAMADAVTHETSLSYTITSHPVAFKTQSTNVVTLDLGRYIEINLSNQHLWVWQDHVVIYDSAITSGATGAGLGTVTGLFSIYYKTTNTRLRGYQYGYDYDVPVKYWMPFYGGYGLHDAVWRNGKFGGPDYYYGGSHGCVNLPDTTAEFIYNWSTVGTPVWVHN
jgi:lipoprotein-anchoring transpeptidase ErfK/SrfK